jgi:hypothetical protein
MRFAASFAGIGCALSFAGLVGCSALLDTGSLTGGRHASSGGGRSGGENSGASAEAGAAGDGSGNAGGDENSGGSSAQGGSAGASSGGANPGGGGSATGGGAAGVPETGGSAGGASCTKTNGGKEICDGLDNDCDPATPDCPAGCSAFSALGVHYMACGALAKWNSANVACLQQTMQLAQIRSSEENAAITTTLQDLHIAGPVWIGGESDPQNNSTFEWLDFTVIYQSGRPVAGVYQNFARNQPVAVNAATTLQMSTANDNSAGTWSNQLPSRSEAFVCKDFTL